MTDPQYMTKIFVDTTKRKKVIFIKVAERQGKKLGDWVMDVLTEHLKAQFIDAAMKSGISFSSYAHTGLPVAVFAKGAGQEKFGGFYDNTQVYHKLADLMGIDK